MILICVLLCYHLLFFYLLFFQQQSSQRRLSAPFWTFQFLKKSSSQQYFCDIKINYLTNKQRYNLLQNEDLFGAQLLDRHKKYIKDHDIPRELHKFSYLKVRDTLFKIPERYQEFTFRVNGRDLKVFGTPEQAETVLKDKYIFGSKKVLFTVGQITDNVAYAYSVLNRLGMKFEKNIMQKDLTGKNVKAIYYNGKWIPLRVTDHQPFVYNLYNDLLQTITSDGRIIKV